MIGTILLALPGVVRWLTPESGIHRLAERLSSCTLTIALALTVLGLGIRLVNRYGWSRGHRLEQLGLAFALGWTLLTLALLLLATLHLFYPQVWGPLILAAYFWWGCGTSGSHNGWSAVKDFQVRRRARLYLRKRYRSLSGALMLLLIVAAFCWSAGPVWDWDAEMYHLPNTKFFLDHHGLAVSYDNEFPNLSGQAYLWYAIPLYFGLDAVPAMWMWLSTVVTSLLAGGYAARWIGPRTGLWTPLVFWSGAIVTAVATTARTEPLVSVLLLAAVVLLTPILTRRERWNWPTIIAAGLLIGSAAGVKYQGFFAWPILALWMLVSWLRSDSTNRMRSFAAMSAVWMIALMVTAPWWVKNWSAFGNPLYPVVSGSARSNSTPPTSSDSAYGPAHQTRGIPTPFTMFREFGLMFINPNRLDGPPGQFPHYLFLLLPGLFWLRKHPVVIGCVVWGCAYYLLSFSLVAMPRYLFPIFPLWSIGVAYLLSECESRYRLTVFFPGLLFFSTLFVLVLPARLLRTPLLAEYLIGKTDDRPLLQHIAHGYHDALDWINKNTPADSRILMCWESREYRLRRAVTIDPLRTTWSSLWSDGRSTPDEIRRELNRRQYDFMLVNVGSLKYNVSVTGHIPAEVLTTFESQRDLLVPEVLTPVYQTGSAIVYRVQGE
ncbi:MAG: hypothetical protein ACKVT0_02180 [Planctomycetaceae bacterium]